MINVRKRLASSMSSDGLAYLVLALPSIVMLLMTGLDFRLVGDEGLYHIKVIEQFANTSLIASMADYPSASTPLPYLLWVLYGKVIGFEVWKLRLLTTIIMYLTAVQFYIISKQQDLTYRLLSTLTLVFMPYAFFYGYTIYTVSFGLFFGVVSLRFYLKQHLRDWVLGALFASCAIYSRQYYLTLPLGMLLYRLVANRHQLISDLRHNLGYWLAAGLPALTVLPLFLLWGGMVPPQHQFKHFVYPVLQHINFLPIFIGFYFAPIIVSPRVLNTLRSRIAVCCVTLVLSIPFYTAFRLVYNKFFDTIGAANGLILHGFELASDQLGNGASEAAKFVVWLVGLAIALATVLEMPWEDTKYKLLALLSAFLMLIVLTPYVSERYYVLIMPYLILLLHRHFRNWKLLVPWVIVQMVLSIGYTYWQVVLNPVNAF